MAPIAVNQFSSLNELVESRPAISKAQPPALYNEGEIDSHALQLAPASPYLDASTGSETTETIDQNDPIVVVGMGKFLDTLEMRQWVESLILLFR